MTKPFIPYARQSLDEDDINAVVEVLRGNWLTQGPKIEEFEKNISRRVGANFGVAVATGTAALHCACFAAGVGPGDEVITSPITFAASGNCALFLGAEVKFVDIRPDTYCLDPNKLSEAINKKTKAIIPVDYTGQPADMDEINEIASHHGITVISDAAHSLGATYKERPVGSLADMSVFSFHPVKHIAMGEGGVIVTNDESVVSSLRLFRTHGITNQDREMVLPKQSSDQDNSWFPELNSSTRAPWYYEMQQLGFNYRITDIQCALGLSQLGKLDQFLCRRREIATYYNRYFSESEMLIIPFQQIDRQSSWHLYMLRLRSEKLTKSRRQIFEEIRSLNIGVHVHYIPLHLQPYYRKKFGYKRGDFPESESYYDSALTIPMFPGMSDSDCERVVEAVLSCVH